MSFKIKAKYKKGNRLIEGELNIDDDFVKFKSNDGDFQLNIPIYRIVQTGYRRKLFSFERYFYFKTSDGVPSVFYVSKPRKCMKQLDSLVYFKKVK